MKRSDKLAFEKSDDSVTVKICMKNATFLHANVLANSLETFLEEGILKFTIDCSECRHFDSTFWGVLTMGALKLAKRKPDAKIEFRHVCKVILDEMVSLGLDRLFAVATNPGQHASPES